MDEIRILQFGDTHFTRHDQFDYTAFKDGVRMLNTLDADYCVHMGDLTQEGLGEDYDLASLLLPSVRKDIFTVPGNHDVKNVGWKLYEQYFGERDFVHIDERVIIIGIDCSIPDRDDSRFSDEDLAIVDDALEKAGDRFKVVVFHCHLFPIAGAGRERNILYNAGDVIEILQRHHVHLVLNGHKHTENVAQFDDIVVVNSGTFSCYKTRQGEDHSFNMIRISPQKDEVTITTHWIESKAQTHTTRRLRPHVSHEIEPDEPEFRLVQMSDLRISDGPDFLSSRLGQALDEINRIRPDHVCICGNLVERGLAYEYEMAFEYLYRIQAPVMCVPGSCDLQHTGNTLFQRYVGDLEPGQENRGVHFIGINTALPHSANGVIGRGKLNTIINKRILPESVNIALFHHKLTSAPGIREHEYIEDAGSSLRTFIESDVDILLTGQQHVGFSHTVDGLIIVNSGTASSRKHYSELGNTMNILTIYNNKILEVEKYIIDEQQKISMGRYVMNRFYK